MREALFSQVERSFWRYNALVLGSLILVLSGIGSYAGFPMTLLAAGVHPDLATVFALEGGLAILALVLRVVARRRWTRIDWMLCRPERDLAARGA